MILKDLVTHGKHCSERTFKCTIVLTTAVIKEYNTEEHEVLAIILENQSTTVDVSLFLSDREVEYYWDMFPDFCSHHTTKEDIQVRSFVSVVAA